MAKYGMVNLFSFYFHEIEMLDQIKIIAKSIHPRLELHHYCYYHHL